MVSGVFEANLGGAGGVTKVEKICGKTDRESGVEIPVAMGVSSIIIPGRGISGPP
jgi:hypothetical protein